MRRRIRRQCRCSPALVPNVAVVSRKLVSLRDQEHERRRASRYKSPSRKRTWTRCQTRKAHRQVLRSGVAADPGSGRAPRHHGLGLRSQRCAQRRRPQPTDWDRRSFACADRNHQAHVPERPTSFLRSSATKLSAKGAPGRWTRWCEQHAKHRLSSSATPSGGVFSTPSSAFTVSVDSRTHRPPTASWRSTCCWSRPVNLAQCRKSVDYCDRIESGRRSTPRRSQ